AQITQEAYLVASLPAARALEAEEESPPVPDHEVEAPPADPPAAAPPPWEGHTLFRLAPQHNDRPNLDYNRLARIVWDAPGHQVPIARVLREVWGDEIDGQVMVPPNKLNKAIQKLNTRLREFALDLSVEDGVVRLI